MIDNMRLTKFRVIKYRSIRDSGEIPVDDSITTFVGINESGKTNILRALRKLNNTMDKTFDDLTEHPMWDFGNFNPEEIFVTATFKLSVDEKHEITKIDSSYQDLQEISFSRKKNMQLICHLKSDQIAIPFESFQKMYLNPMFELIQQIDSTTIDDGVNAKQRVLNSFNTIGNGFTGHLNVRLPESLSKINEQINAFKTQINSLPPTQYNPSQIHALLDKITTEVKEDSIEKVKNYLIKKLPRFIYFENIAIIDSRIHLPTFVQKLDAGDLDDDEQTAKTLLDMAGLNPKELFALGQEKGKDLATIRKDKDRLQIMCSLASKRITEQIDAIWTQNDHNVEIVVDANHLRVWIVNRADGTKLQLEERSRGYQWYFSFYVVFNVQSETRNKDAILLLDEPALFLHAIGQADFLEKSLPKLAEKNQIMYTTHSPFLIDLTRPESIHTVIVDNTKNKETQISVDVWASDKNALFPLQSALGYHLSQSMFIGKRNMIVEGITDFWIISSASELFRASGKVSLNDDFVFSPAGGGTKTVLLSTMYVGQKLDVGVLLDSDNEGKQALEMLTKNKILKENKILSLSDVLGKSGKELTIEDIFPEDYYLKFVELTYQTELKGKKIVLDSSDGMLIKRIEAYFHKNGLGKFHKSRPDRAVMKEFSTTSIDKVPTELITNLETIISTINKVMN